MATGGSNKAQFLFKIKNPLDIIKISQNGLTKGG
jgi:hypothetical protein